MGFALTLLVAAFATTKGASAGTLATPPFRVGSEALRDDHAGLRAIQPKTDAKTEKNLGKDNRPHPGAYQAPDKGSHKLIKHTYTLRVVISTLGLVVVGFPLFMMNAGGAPTYSGQTINHRIPLPGPRSQTPHTVSEHTSRILHCGSWSQIFSPTNSVLPSSYA